MGLGSLVFCLWSVLWADEPRISASLSPSSATIGDRVRWIVDVDADEGSKIDFPDLKGNLGDVEVKQSGKETPKSLGEGRARYTFWAIVSSYATGTRVIPPISVKVRPPDGGVVVLETLKQILEVKSVLRKGEKMEELRDIKGVLSLGGVSFGWLLIFFLAAGAFAAGVVLYLRKKKVFSEALAPLSAQELALSELARLDGSGLAQRDIKEFHFWVSLVLRRYLEAQFSLKAPEKTTEEFLEASSKADFLNEPDKKFLKNFLEQCDLVKFAKFTPASWEAVRLSRLARDFIVGSSRAL